MIAKLSPVAEEYVRAVNESDAVAYVNLFAEDAVVDDAGRIFQGRAAIAPWSKSDIFDAAVTLEVLEVDERGAETLLTTKVDGNFDRTGLPDPVVIDHTIQTAKGKITSLTCRLAN